MTADRPNILLIVVHDLGTHLRCYDWDPLIPGINVSLLARWPGAGDDIKRCIRTRRHKYIRNFDEGPILQMPSDSEISSTRRDMGDDHLAARPPVELYDLQQDPLETVNLAGQHESADIERRLAAQLQAFMEETDDPVLRGPIERPYNEAELVERVRERTGTRLAENRKKWAGH